MLQFIFFGRLVREKGFDAILDVWRRFVVEKETKVRLFVFWDGPLREDLLELMKETTMIHYFWRQDRDMIAEYCHYSHYALMPSRFLETFGLSALEALSLGVPVIWRSVWWMTSFVHPDLDLEKMSWQKTMTLSDSLYDKLVSIMTADKRKQYDEWIQTVVLQYSQHQRKKRFESYYPKKNTNEKKNKEKILLISDYKNNIWWIESYILDTKKRLTDMWYDVTIFGSTLTGKRQRRLWLLMTTCNIPAYFSLKKIIKKEKPDLVWWHSTDRWLWRLPLRAVSKKTTQRKMYHTFGFAVPFPAHQYEEKKLPKKRSLRHFLKAVPLNKRRQYPFVVAKYIQLSLMRSHIQKMDLVMWPSDCVTHTIRQLWYTKKKTVAVTFPHCLK